MKGRDSDYRLVFLNGYDFFMILFELWPLETARPIDTHISLKNSKAEIQTSSSISAR